MSKDTREVLRGIGVHEDNKFRAVTEPDEVSAMYSQDELNAFVEAGVLSGGEWKSTKVETVEDQPEPVESAPLTIEETMKRMNSFDFSDEVTRSMAFYKDELPERLKGKMKQKDSDLPEDFPLRSRLVEQGVAFEQVKSMSRADLVALKYVTDSNVDSILNYGKEQ